MKNMLFVRLGKHLINLPNVTEINLGDETSHIVVCYNNDDQKEIDPDSLEKGALEKFEACILGVKDENVLFAKLGLHLVNLARVSGIWFGEKEVEIYYDDGYNTTIGNEDIKPDALQKLNEHIIIIA